MRALVIAAATFALAACGGNGPSGNTANIDQSLAAENIVTNDVTAIDAVTGADANMAADVDYNAELANGLDNELNAAVNRAASASRRPAPRATQPIDTPAENTAANTTE